MHTRFETAASINYSIPDDSGRAGPELGDTHGNVVHSAAVGMMHFCPFESCSDIRHNQGCRQNVEHDSLETAVVIPYVQHTHLQVFVEFLMHNRSYNAMVSQTWVHWSTFCPSWLSRNGHLHYEIIKIIKK